MCGNRVEELEEQVQQLQATVDGLTDELVECKVRIGELEEAVDTEPAIGGTTGSGQTDAEAEADAGTETEEAAESNNTEAPEPTDETETESDSDIIIA